MLRSHSPTRNHLPVGNHANVFNVYLFCLFVFLQNGLCCSVCMYFLIYVNCVVLDASFHFLCLLSLVTMPAYLLSVHLTCTVWMPTTYLVTDPGTDLLIASNSIIVNNGAEDLLVHDPLHLCMFLFFSGPDCSPEALERACILKFPSWPTFWHFPASHFLPN